MGTFVNARLVNRIAKSTRSMIRRNFARMERSTVVPKIVKPALQGAKKKMIRKLTGQKSPLKPHKFRTLRRPYPGNYQMSVKTPFYSPNYGRVLNSSPTFKNFTVKRPPVPKAMQIFKEDNPFKVRRQLPAAFVRQQSKMSYPILSRSTTANLVGIRSPLANRNANATAIELI